MSDTGSGAGRDRIAEIRVRLDAATPGPWARAWDDDVKTRPDSDEVIISQATGIADDDRVVVGGIFYDGMWTACTREDSALIAHAPDDLRYLIDRVAELERVIAMGGHTYQDASTHSAARLLPDSEDSQELWGLRKDDLYDVIHGNQIGEATGSRYIAFRGGQKVAKARIVAALSRMIGPLLYRANSYGRAWSPEDDTEA